MKKWIIVCFTILLLAITASAQDNCDGSETENRRGRAVADGNTSTTCPTTTPTSQPAIEFTPIPTTGATPSGPTPIPTTGAIRSEPIYIDIQGMPFITETFEFPEISSIATLSYPEDWTVKPHEYGSFLLSNNPDLLEEDADISVIPSDTVYVVLLIFDEELASLLIDDVEAASPMTLLASFLEFVPPEEDIPQIDDITVTTLNDKPTAMVAGIVEGTETMMMILELEEYYVFAFGATAIGELDENIDVIHAIAGSLSLADAE